MNFSNDMFIRSNILIDDRGVGAGWARAHSLFCLIFIEKGRFPNHFWLLVEYFLVLPAHFEEASDAPED